MCAAKNNQAVTPAVTPTPATPASMLAALQAATTTKQQGIFTLAVHAAFGVHPPLVLGGVQAPQRGGAIANVWLQYLHMLQQGITPTCVGMVAALPQANTNNTKQEFYRAAKWFSALPAWVAAQTPNP